MTDMYCTKCGAKFPDVYVYCPECGQEAHMLSREDLLEEDLLNGIMDEDESAGDSGLQGRIGSYHNKSREYLKKKKEEARKRKMRRNLIILLVVAAAVAAGGISYLFYSQNHSVDYQMTKAVNAYNTKDYTTARNALDKVLSLDEDNIDAMLLAGSIDTIMKDYQKGESLLKKVIEIDPMNQEGYRALIALYDKQGDRDKILELLSHTHNQEIRALFDEFVVPVPVIDPENGSYSDDLSVSIAAENNKLVIYYTLDGTEPNADSERYAEPIALSEQGDYVIKAVCMDEEGYYSDPVQANYTIKYNTPAMPAASPDGGQFSTPVKVTVTVPEGTTVYYSWNGSEPDEDSSEYTGALTIPEGNNILSLVAIDKHGMRSGVLKCNYIYYPQVSERDWDEEESSAVTENTEADEIQGDTN